MPASRAYYQHPYGVWLRVRDNRPNKLRPLGAARLLKAFPDEVLDEVETMAGPVGQAFSIRTTHHGLAVLAIRGKDAESFRVACRVIVKRAKALDLYLSVDNATKPAQRVIEAGI